VFVLTTKGAIDFLTYFNGTNGYGPTGGLIEGSNGVFYGTTFVGGLGFTQNTIFNGEGEVFSVSNGIVTSLHSFFSGTSEGRRPHCRLIKGQDGLFYGTTAFGGAHDKGTIFKITTDGTLTTLASLDGTNGESPWAGLVQASDGTLYGTAEFGGNYNQGTVFQLATNGILTAVVHFDGTNGANPLAPLTMGPDGNLYGTASGGGTNDLNYGTIFKISATGDLTTVLDFNGTNGSVPSAGLTLASDGNLYGSTAHGGDTYNPASAGWGTLFQLTTNGGLTTLASFNGTNGTTPWSLLEGPNGSFYGTTQQGGVGTRGTIYRLSPLSPILLHLAQTGANLLLTWTAVPGQSYQPQYKGNLSDTNWTSLGPPLTATNISATASDSITGIQRFYRVALQTP
jgi:uncharacterized repeat protein (TIGR03803 family)